MQGHTGADSRARRKRRPRGNPACGALWRRVECVETGESVDVHNPHPGHVLRALALLSESEIA